MTNDKPNFSLPKLENVEETIKSLIPDYQLWLFVDTTILESAEDKLRAIERSLFFSKVSENTPVEDEWDTPPLLCQLNLDAIDIIIPEFVKSLATESQAILIATKPEIQESELLKHLGALLFAKIDDGRAWFRFWDSARMRGLLTSLAKEELLQNQFYGPISKFIWFEPAPYSEDFYIIENKNKNKNLVSTSLNFGEFTVSSSLRNNLNEYDEWCFKNKLLSDHRMELVRLDSKKTPESLFDWLYRGVESMGFTTEDGISDLFSLATKYSRKQITHPTVKNILLNGHPQEYVRVHKANEFLSSNSMNKEIK